MMKHTQRGALVGAFAAAALLCLQTSYAVTPTPAASDKPADAEKPAATESAAKKDAELFPDTVVAKGKGFEIKRSKLEEALVQISAQASANGQPIPQSERAGVESEVLHDMIFKEILNQKATAEDKAKAKEKADKYIEDVRKKFGEDDFQAKLKMEKLTLEELQKSMLEDAVCTVVLDREIKSKVIIPDDDIKKFYDEHADKFEKPEQVRASHILILTMDKDRKPVTADQKKEKEKLAKDIKARADKGEDFAKLAKEFSEDPGSKEKGGELPPFARNGEMVPEFEAAAFSLKTNQISDIVETEYGYHIIKLAEKIPASKVPLTEVSPKIKDYLTGQQIRKTLPTYREAAEKEANVELIGIKDVSKTADKPSEEKPAATNAPAAK